MVLPLYLAMSVPEMAAVPALSRHPAPMVLDRWPGTIPSGSMLVVTDRLPPDPARIITEVRRLDCGSVLLDFEGEPDKMVADALFEALPCPVAAPPAWARDSGCAVFLPSCPLHVPLEEYLRPWASREVWLDVTARQQTITVTAAGTRYGPAAPADRQEDGFPDETLLCRCATELSADAVRFTLFDTAETLEAKMKRAAALGVTRAVGLYQEWCRIGGCIFRDGGLE